MRKSLIVNDLGSPPKAPARKSLRYSGLRSVFAKTFVTEVPTVLVSRTDEVVSLVHFLALRLSNEVVLLQFAHQHPCLLHVALHVAQVPLNLVEVVDVLIFHHSHNEEEHTIVGGTCQHFNTPIYEKGFQNELRVSAGWPFYHSPRAF